MFRPFCRKKIVGGMLAFLIAAAPLAATHAQSDATLDILSRVNALRRQNGLAPLELNDQLSAAAQRHSQDMANSGNVSHAGSDGSTTEQRIRQAGYGPDMAAWGENIYGGGIAVVDDAWNFWTTSTVHRNNLLSERYREIGIGAATSANGAYFTLNFGSRPGVLPFFVDPDGVLSSPNVTLLLSNEEATPGGSGGSMGRAVEVRAGEEASPGDWQPWQRSIPFTLSNVAGPHRITVDYRDVRGTIASYFRTVSLGSIAPTATLAPTTTPTDFPSDTPTFPPTAAPTDTVTPTPTPSRTLTPASSATPSPTLAPTEARLPPATATREPAATVAPSPSIQPETAAAPVEKLIERGWSDAPLDWLGLIVGLQAGAILIGAWIALRRLTRS